MATTKLSGEISFKADSFTRAAKEVVTASDRVKTALAAQAAPLERVAAESNATERAMKSLAEGSRVVPAEIAKLDRLERTEQILEVLALRSNDLATRMSDLTRRAGPAGKSLQTFSRDANQAASTGGKFGWQAQQLAFAFDDFSSSTGDVSNRLRGVQNNLTAVAAGMGGLAGAAATLGTIGALSLIKWISEQHKLNEAVQNASYRVDDYVRKNVEMVSLAESLRDRFTDERDALKSLTAARLADGEALTGSFNRIKESLELLEQQRTFDRQTRELKEFQTRLDGMNEVLKSLKIDDKFSANFDADSKQYELLKERERLEGEIFTRQQQRSQAEEQAASRRIAALIRERRILAERSGEIAEQHRLQIAAEAADANRLDGNSFNVGAATDRIQEIDNREEQLRREIRLIEPQRKTENRDRILISAGEELKRLAEEELELRKQIQDEVLKKQDELEKKRRDDERASKQAATEARKLEDDRLKSRLKEQTDEQSRLKKAFGDAGQTQQSLTAVGRDSAEAQQLIDRTQREALRQQDQQPIIDELKQVVAAIKQTKASIEKNRKKEVAATGVLFDEI